MEIRKAVPEDIPAIADTYERLLTFEKEHGTHSHWVLGVYPTAAVPKKAVPAGTMYVLREEEKICASMIFDHDQPPEYASISWNVEAPMEKVLVIHTLCIPPEQQGKGFGREMVRFARERGKQMGCTCVRIDTWLYNEPAQRLYRKCGFEAAGTGKILLHGRIEEDQIYMDCSL